MNNKEIEEVYKRYYKPLFLFAYSLTGNKEISEDLTSETFLKSLTTFKGGSIGAWMYTVLRNLFYDMLRKEKFKGQEKEIPSNDDILERFIENEEKRWLFKKITLLPQREKEIMMLTLYLGYKDEEIAKITNLKVANVRVIRHRAKEKIINSHKEENL